MDAAAHQLSDAEKDEVVRLVNQPAYRNLSPEQAVAKLAGEGIYVCSERSMRRVPAERQLDRYRLRSKPAKGHSKPRQHIAHEPLRVLSWDITYMRSSTVRGGFFYLYLFLDIWSRRIVGAEVRTLQPLDRATTTLTNPVRMRDERKSRQRRDNQWRPQCCRSVASRRYS